MYHNTQEHSPRHLSCEQYNSPNAAPAATNESRPGVTSEVRGRISRRVRGVVVRVYYSWLPPSHRHRTRPSAEPTHKVHTTHTLPDRTGQKQPPLQITSTYIDTHRRIESQISNGNSEQALLPAHQYWDFPETSRIDLESILQAKGQCRSAYQSRIQTLLITLVGYQ